MNSNTARKKRKPETERTLGWRTKDGGLIQVNNMENSHLLNSISMLRRKIMLTKLQTGVTSLSILSLRYLEAEANDRGLKHDLENQPF